MTVALIVGFATITALIAAAVWVVSIVRADGRERAAALQLAEKLQGDLNVERERATATITALAKSVRAATRRADALEEFARSNVAGGVGDGVDLLLAELSIIAAGSDDDADILDITPGPGRGVDTAGAVSDSETDPATPVARARDARSDETMPGGKQA